MLTITQAQEMLLIVKKALHERVGPLFFGGRRYEDLTQYQDDLLTDMARIAIVTAFEVNKAFLEGRQPDQKAQTMLEASGYNIMAEVEILLGKQNFYGSPN
jgi:hypothetical protein